jgi:hypothetical protein
LKSTKFKTGLQKNFEFDIMRINCILLSHMIVHVWQAYLIWDTCHMLYLDYLTTHTSLSPIRRGFAPGFINYNKEYTRLSAASDKVYQLLAHGRWFSPASSTTKIGRHDIAGSGVKHQKSNQIDHILYPYLYFPRFVSAQ